MVYLSLLKLVRSRCACERDMSTVTTDWFVSRIFVQFISEPVKSLDPSVASTQPEEFALNIMNFTYVHPSKILVLVLSITFLPIMVKGLTVASITIMK